MTERPILFSAPMVRAILDGTKTVTRRLLKPQPSAELKFGGWISCSTHREDEGKACWHDKIPFVTKIHRVRCPYGKPGDRLWVREAFARNAVLPLEHRPPGMWIYRADRCARGMTKYVAKWTPSIHMPRAASRLTLEIATIRVERLHDITEEQAVAEGVTASKTPDLVTVVFRGGDTLQISPNYVHGVPKPGDIWHGQLVTHVEPSPGSITATARENFAHLWRSLNGPDSWEQNPWVWPVSFRKINPVSEIQ